MARKRKRESNFIKEVFVQLIVETCSLFELIRRLDEKTMKKVRQDFAQKCIGSYASSTAFFFFISIIPMFTLISALIPYTGMSEGAVVAAITAVTPNAVDEVVTLMIRDAFGNSTGILSLSLVTLIWSSAKGTYSLILGLNAVMRTGVRGRARPRSFLERNIMSVVYTVLLLGLIMATLLVMVFGGTLVDLFATYFPEVNFSFSMDTKTRYILILVMSTLFFMLVYNYVPDENRSFITLFPGALFSTFGWFLFSGFYSVFIGKGSIYNTYYGSLATVVLFLIWLYGCFYILLIGAYINLMLSGDISPGIDNEQLRRPVKRRRRSKNRR